MSSPSELREHVMNSVAEYLGREPVVFGDSGDIPIRWGSALYCISIVDHDPVLVRVWSEVLTDVNEHPDLYRALNAFNAEVHTARIYWQDGRIVAATELPARTLDAEEIAHACRSVGALADRADTALQPRFGGARAFRDEQAGR